MIKAVLRLNALSFVVAIIALLFTTITANVLLTENTHAADGKNFRPGRIIDDAIFYNKTSMTASQIQSFLNGKVPSCDTNGSGIATEYGSNMTRAQFAASQGWQSPPYTCLRNFKMNTPQVEAASQLCEGLTAKTNRTAAQIILDISVACGINPQVLIVLLQKEQSLVTDIWPLNSQYKHATGFACPDTAPCNDTFSGFFFQTYYAAKQFKIYKLYQNNYNYIAGRNNTVKWNPLSSCGTSTFFIENQATAGLYIYTPYRPNAAALNNLYGSGDKCSSYGNRNFWRLFTDWFGATTGPLIESSGLLLYGWNTGEQITAIFDIKNITKSPLNVDYIRVRAVNENSNQYLFPAKDNLVLQPGERYKYQQSLTMTHEGNFTFYIDRKVGSTWYSVPFSDFNFTYSTATKKTRTISHAPTVTTSLQLNKSSIHVNEPVAATFSVKNNSVIKAVDIGTLKVEGADTSNTLHQFEADNDIVLDPGETHSYNKTLSLNKTGKMYFEIVNNGPNLGWNKTYPESDSPSIVRRVHINVKDQVTVTEGLSLNTTRAREGESITATFKIKNFGTTAVNVGTLKVETFDASGKQYQFAPTESNLTLAPGQEYTYSKSRVVPPKGRYDFHIINNNGRIGWNNTLPASETPSIARQAELIVKFPVEIISSLSATPRTQAIGERRIDVTFKLRNFSTAPINLRTLKVGVYDANGNYYPAYIYNNDDRGGMYMMFNPGEERDFVSAWYFQKRGTYTLRIVYDHPTYGWTFSLPPSSNNTIIRTQTITIK